MLNNLSDMAKKDFPCHGGSYENERAYTRCGTVCTIILKMVFDAVFSVFVYPGLSSRQALFGSMQSAVTEVMTGPRTRAGIRSY